MPKGCESAAVTRLTGSKCSEDPEPRDVNLRTLGGACTVRSHGDTQPKRRPQTRLRDRHARSRGTRRALGTGRPTPRRIIGRLRTRRDADPKLPTGPEGGGAEGRDFAQEVCRALD